METHLFIYFLSIAVISYQEVANTKVILEWSLTGKQLN